jgi:hypothetical protein
MDKATLIAKRQELFEEILRHLNIQPSKIDKLLNQDKYYIAPDMENTYVNSEYGDMAIHVSGQFYDKKFSVSYLFWQLGNTFKIGITLTDDELQGAFASDAHNEIYYIWGVKNEPKIDVARGCVFYDWEFEVPDLYDNYKNQERFILGTKHMHFRTMRIIHDECERIFFNSANIDEDDSEFIEDLERVIKSDNDEN